MTFNSKLQYIVLFMMASIPLMLCGCSQTSKPAAPELKIGVIPYEAASAIQEQYGPFADYIGSKMHRKTTIIGAQDYIGIVQALASDQIDVAYLNPLSYVLFADKMKDTPEHLVPISMPWVHGSLYYYGVIFTTTGSGINTIADLKGKKMAFVDQTSTSGYLYPYEYLVHHGINPKTDFSEQPLFASANGVVPAVLNNSVDAGAIFEEGLELSTKNDPADFKRLKVLARVGPIANGMLVARGNLDPQEIAQLKQTLIDINTDPAGQKSLRALQVTKWQPADDSVFDPVRVAAKILGLNLSVLKKK